MIFKNIELHNINDIKPFKDGGFIMFRNPSEFTDKFYFGEQAIRLNSGPTGVEFRFVMNSDKVILRLGKQYLDKSLLNNHILNIMHIFYGSVQGTWADHNRFIETDETYDLVITKPNNMDVLRDYGKKLDEGFSSDVVRVIVDSGYLTLVDVIGDVRPPLSSEVPSKTLLAYGSSITHGSNALNSSYNWINLVGKHLKYDVLNKAMAGSCALEPQMADYLASLGEKDQWHMAVLELGINVNFWKSEEIRPAVTNMLKQVAGRNPTKKVYVISPLWCNEDYIKSGNTERWRKEIAEIIKELAYPNVFYINGLDLIDNSNLISADEVHPNIYGNLEIARKLINIIKE